MKDDEIERVVLDVSREAVAQRDRADRLEAALAKFQSQGPAAMITKLEQRIISLEAGARVQAATIRRLSDQVGSLLMERALPAAVAADPVRAEAERAGPPTPRDAALAGEVTGNVGRPALPGGSVRELAEEVERLTTENGHLRRAISDAEAHIKRIEARA
jgi:hypothetical protein